MAWFDAWEVAWIDSGDDVAGYDSGDDDAGCDAGGESMAVMM